jgi:L,D-transpeptidase ErfK/SrfK
MHSILKFLASLLLCTSLPSVAWSESYLLPPVDVDIIGHVQTTRAQAEDTLLDIARNFDIGQEEILHANPEVDRWLPGAGTEVTIPSRYILPDAERTGLVLNVPEMRLYYFPRSRKGEQQFVQTFPVSIGRMNWTTPIGKTRIVAKVKDPSWRPPASIKQEAAARGEPLPDVIRPGPDNPLGKYALRLGLPEYLIHSTNKPYGVGMRVTHGCVRMYPEDIEGLFQDIPQGTQVQIVNQPIKLGRLGELLYIEIHPPLDEEGIDDQGLLQLAVDTVHEYIQEHPALISGEALLRAVHLKDGMPTLISRETDI